MAICPSTKLLCVHAIFLRKITVFKVCDTELTNQHSHSATRIPTLRSAPSPITQAISAVSTINSSKQQLLSCTSWQSARMRVFINEWSTEGSLRYIQCCQPLAFQKMQRIKAIRCRRITCSWSHSLRSLGTSNLSPRLHTQPMRRTFWPLNWVLGSYAYPHYA